MIGTNPLSCRPALVLTFLCCLLALSHAQITNVTDTQSTPIEGVGHDYIKMLSETVNPSNGSLSLRIEVPMPKGRGISLPFAFTYNSNGILHLEPVEGLPGYSEWWTDRCGALGGWGTTLPGLCSHYWSFEVTNPNQPPQSWWCQATSDYIFTDASGGRHALGLGTEYSYGQSGSCPQSGNSRSQGGDDQVRASLSNNQPDPLWNPDARKECPTTVNTSDGTVYTFPCSGTSSIEDRNGNMITATSGTYTDTAGRTIVSVTGPAPAPGVTDIWSLGGETYKVYWTSTSPSYTVPSIRVTDPRYYGYCTPPPAVGNTTLTVVSSITLPNYKQFVFHYGNDNSDHSVRNDYGLLNEIDYPSGAWVKYRWQLSSTMSETVNYPAYNNPQPIQDGCIYQYETPVVTGRIVSYGSEAPVLAQNSSYRTLWDPNNAAKWTEKDTSVGTWDEIRGGNFVLVNYVYGSVGVSNNNPVSPTGNSGQVPVENTIKYYDWNNSTTPVRTVSKSWYDQFLLKSEQTVLQDVTPPISSQINYFYSSGILPQLTKKDEYDYGATTPSRETVIRYQNFPGALGIIADRPCQTTVYDSGGNTVADTYLYYDNSTGLCTPLAGGSTLPGTGAYTNHDETNYGTTSTLPRGNVTAKMQVLTGGTSPVTFYMYDETGQVRSMTDPCGGCADMPPGTSHTTTYSFADSYASGSNTCTASNGPAGNTNALLTQITYPPTSGTVHSECFSYDYNNGQLTGSKDQNGKLTTYAYDDVFFRPTMVNYPDGGQTNYSYDDTPRSLSVTIAETIDNTVTPTVVKTTKTQMDGAGHVVQTQLTSDPDGATFVDMTYDGMGQVYTRSNPHRSPGAPTDGTTTYLYDWLGRPCVVGQPDGTAVSAPPCPATAPAKDIFTKYAGNCTTATDETGKSRTFCSDAFGRLTKVLEDPSGLNYETDYRFDTLGNLICAVQKGTDTTPFTSCSAAPPSWRPRSFQYDSLSRLTSAANPESGVISYTYDANGNVTAKTSPKPNQGNASTTGTVNYCYDALNRVTSKDYNNSTCPSSSPQASYTYDQGTNGIGRRTGMTDLPGSSTWTYDLMGRVVTESRTTAGKIKNTTYSYNQGGLLKSIIYPSGRTLNYTYNSSGGNISAGRPTSVIDSTGAINYLTSATYAPQGALQTHTSGSVSGGFTGLNTVNTYNSRLQPVLLLATNPTATILSLCYDFHSGTSISQPPCSFPASTTGDNGNVFQIVNNRDTNRTQVFTYDNLNRVLQANSNGSIWGETFTIDSWGNLTNRGPVARKTYTEPLNAPALTNNQLTGFGYDAAGNMTSNGSATYQYNQEGQFTKFITTDTDIYYYDGDGQRVKKNIGAVTLYWHGMNGNVLDETTSTGALTSEYVYFNGKRIARRDADNSVHYYFSDHLGSASVVTDAVGTMSICTNSPMGYASIPTGEEESEYYPYGGEMKLCDNASQHYKFAGKERDSESGLDNFGARYDASNLGRFMTPDPGPWTLLSPQSYNAYSYGLNNPLRYSDDSGETAQDRVNAANKLAAQAVPYARGGGHPGNVNETCGLDCSGLVYQVFKADPDNNINIGGSAAIEASELQRGGDFSTNISDAQPGDAIFWTDSEGNVVHTGIVVDVRDGKVYFVHAPRPGKNVNKFYVTLKRPNLLDEKFKGVGRPRETSPLQTTKSSGGYWSSFVQWWTWSLYSSPTQSQPKPNPEPGAKPHKKVYCLKNRDGSCVN